MEMNREESIQAAVGDSLLFTPGFCATVNRMFHELIRVWFGWVESWGYLGVFVLMAMESSVIPVPAEIVIPPAAFWASQGRMTFFGIVVASALGSLLGSVISYGAARGLGLPVIRRYGKYFLITEFKLTAAEAWLKRFGAFGIFLGRQLPVVRHLISIPAGVLKMPLGVFSVSTVLGAAAYTAILAWFGEQVLGGHPELLQSPELMMAAIKGKLHWVAWGALIFTGLFLIGTRFRPRAMENRANLANS